MGPDRYGDYVRVIAVTSWVGLFSEFGLTKIGVRDAAREEGRAGAVVGTVMGTRLVLSLAAAGIAQAILVPLHATATVHVAALVASLLFVSDALFSTIVVFQVSLKQHYEAGMRVAMEVVELAILITLIVHHAGLVALVAAPVVAGAVGCSAGYAVARRRFGLQLSFDARLARSMVRSAAPIVPAIMIGVLTVKLDSLMVAALRPRHDVGLYGAAYQPVEYAFNAVAVVALPFFPILARSHRRNGAEFLQAYRRGTECVLAFVLPITGLALVAGTPVVAAVYDHSWLGSAAPLRLLSVALIFMALSAWNGFVLLAADRQRMSLVYGVAAFVVSFVLCLVLIPTVGFMGGAIAAVAANVMSATWSTVLVHRHAHVSTDPGRILRVVLGAALLAGIAAGLRVAGVVWWAACSVGLASYPFWLSALGLISPRRLWHSVRRGNPALAVGGAA